jgi:hypothetical protein
MTNTQLKTAIANLKESIMFQIDQVEFSATKATKEDPTGAELNIWSRYTSTGAFHCTSIIALFNNRNCYLHYEGAKQRIELKVY